MAGRLTLTTFTDDDMGRMKGWLAKDRVRAWYTHPEAWLYELENRAGEYAFVRHFIARLDGRPVGFGQYYPVAAAGEPEYASYPADGTYSIDYMLGEDDCLGRGLGADLVAALVSAVSALPDARLVVVDPDEANAASRACLASNGFSLDPSTGVFTLRLPAR